MGLFTSWLAQQGSIWTRKAGILSHGPFIEHMRLLMAVSRWPTALRFYTNGWPTRTYKWKIRFGCIKTKKHTVVEHWSSSQYSHHGSVLDAVIIPSLRFLRFLSEQQNYFTTNVHLLIIHFSFKVENRRFYREFHQIVNDFNASVEQCDIFLNLWSLSGYFLYMQ